MKAEKKTLNTCLISIQFGNQADGGNAENDHLIRQHHSFGVAL